MAASQNGASHVPAWKKIGLKLKNANDEPTTPVVNGSPADVVAQPQKSNVSKSKRSRDDGEETRGSKKRRTSDLHDSNRHVSSTNSSLNNESSTPIVATPAKITFDEQGEPKSQTPSSLRRPRTNSKDQPKSVSFSDDTKTEDGDSIKQTYQTWLFQQQCLGNTADFTEKDHATARQLMGIEEPAPIVSTSKPLSEETISTTSPPKPQQPKKSKQKKGESKKSTGAIEVPTERKTKVRTPKADDKPTPGYVRYLEQYHTNRTNWKFNKSKQTDLFKNIWNIYRVTPEHNDALIGYISGLQGDAARRRLKEGAQKVIVDSVAFIRQEIPQVKEQAMEAFEARRAAYEEALEREMEKMDRAGIDTIKEEKQETLRRKMREDERAAKIMIELMQEDLEESGLAPLTEDVKLETARSKKRRRRARVTAASDSDNDSDSSGSDSDGDKLDKAKKHKMAVNGKKANAGSDSDSSSESDSGSETSSSDSESDSDSAESSSEEDSSDSASSGSEEESGSESD